MATASRSGTGGCGAPVEAYSAWASRPRRRSSATAVRAAKRELPMPSRSTRSASARMGAAPSCASARRRSAAARSSSTSSSRSSGRRSAIVLKEPAHPGPGGVDPARLELRRVHELVGRPSRTPRPEGACGRRGRSRRGRRLGPRGSSSRCRPPDRARGGRGGSGGRTSAGAFATSRRAVPGAARCETGRVGSPSKSSTTRRSPDRRIWPMWKSPWTRWRTGVTGRRTSSFASSARIRGSAARS